jgi:carbon-monoxide dehydrogenase medium subunit
VLTGQRSRKHIAPFDLVRPTSIDACLRWLSRGPRIGLMAGGLDLIDRMKFGQPFDTVVSLSAIPDLKGIRRNDGAIIVGALTTHAALSRDPLIAETIPDLATLWREIANPRVRHIGTIGGNIMSRQPHYDALPALMALGASTTIADPATGVRTVALSDLRDDALLIDLIIPVTGARLVTDRSLHPSVSVYIGATLNAADVTNLRVAFGGAYPHPRYVDLPAHDLRQSDLGAKAATLADIATRDLPEPLTDGFASARYRRRMLEVLTRRSLIRLGHLL